MRQLSQIATISLQNAGVILKCDVYYKLRQYREKTNVNEIIVNIKILFLLIQRSLEDLIIRLHEDLINSLFKTNA